MNAKGPPPPRYLRFLRSLVVTGAVASVPLMSACSEDEGEETDCAEGDCGPADSGIADAGEPVVVDGPLPPPDLPVAVA